MVQVSFSTSTTFNGDLNALIEDQGTSLTARFDLDEPAPVGGLKVFIDSDVEQIVSRLNLPGFITNPTVENINPNLLGTSFDNSGFFVTIDEGATSGSFTIDVFNNAEPDTFLPETFDGLVEAEFELKTQDEVEDEDLADVGTLGDYTIDPSAAASTVLFADEESQLTDTPEPPEPPTPNVVTDIEPNDTIPTALPTGLSPDSPAVVIEGAVSLDLENNPGVDNTEDVDFYQFDLTAGDTIAIDVDAMQLGSAFEASITLFDADGNTLITDVGESEPLANEFFFSQWDPHFEYTVDADGTYYLGVASYPNYDPSFAATPQDPIDVFGTDSLEWLYDPFVSGSGTGATTGEYTINLGLNGAEVPGEETPDNTPDTPPGSSDNLTISFDTVAGTYGAEFDVEVPGVITSPFLVESVEEGGAALAFSLTADGEIPSGGIEVVINSDAPLADYLSSLNFPPFSPGTEVLEGVIDPDTGEVTGIRFLMQAPNVILSLPVFNNETEDGPRPVTYTLEPGAGYTVDADASSSTVTFYDTLDQVPALTVEPEVSLSVSTTELIEADGTTTTLTFELSEAPSEEGTLVYVDSGINGALGELNVLGAEVEGGTFPSSNGFTSGFYFKITEQTASITLSAFPDNTPEGIEAFNFALIPGAGYTIAEDANTANITIADTAESQITVSYGFEPETLIEAEATASVHTFSLSSAPPADGVTISVSAPNLDEFDLTEVSVEGGEIVAVREDGFDLKITDQEAMVTVPVNADGEDEGLETDISFTIEPGDDYEVSSTANTASFTIADVANDLPIADIEVNPEVFPGIINDTLEQAQSLNLGAENTSAIVNGAIAETFGQLDASEDVDLYSFDLNAGQTISIDLDSIAGVLRLFDSEGGEVLLEDVPGNPSFEFTATEAGTYYVGVSQQGNTTYDPLEAASGSGIILPEEGIEVGEYTLNASLTGDQTGSDIIGTDDSETLDGNDADNLIAGLLGDDTLYGNGGDDVLRGDLNSRDPGGSVGGNDVISGGDGNDQIGGKGGNDLLSGDAGDDLIWGDDGNDTIMGVTGNDILTGDDFSGGSGSDLFVFGNGDGTDTITDFDVTEDMIGLVEGELTFADISIIDMSGDAAIQVMSTGETLAILDGVEPSAMTEDLFVVTPDVSFA